MFEVNYFVSWQYPSTTKNEYVKQCQSHEFTRFPMHTRAIGTVLLHKIEPKVLYFLT